jgi:hypothetical protein
MGEMTQPPQAWPELDEDSLRAQAYALQKTHDELVAALDAWQNKKAMIFNSQNWFGAASSAAERKVDIHIQRMVELKDKLSAAIGFFNDAYAKVHLAKEVIARIADAGQSAIDQMTDASNEDGEDRSHLIEQIVEKAFKANSQVVDSTASSIGTKGRPDIPLPDDMSSMFQQPTSGYSTKEETQPTAGIPSLPSQSDGETGYQGHQTDQMVRPNGGGQAQPQTINAGYQRQQEPGAVPTNPTTDQDFNRYFPPAASDSGASGGGSYGPGPVSGGGGGGLTSSPGGGGGGGGSTASPMGGGRNSLSDKATNAQDAKLQTGEGAAAAENRPLTPFEQQQSFVNEVSKGLATGGQQALQQVPQTIANATATGQAPLTPTTPTNPVATPPAAAAGPSTTPVGGGAFGAGGGGAGPAPISSAPPVAPPTPMPLAPPATPPPAGPVGGSAGSSAANAGGTAPAGPGVHAASTNSASQAAQAAPAPIPVSAARMERDAIASAAAAGALHRRRGGAGDAVTLARRIAAALNVGVMDFGFYWVTGVCVDGTIVVANSYGLAYIPENVSLPAQVQMATADESIPPTERAKWSTYPMLAVQGWVHAHGQKLRAVVATEAQFANFDPGAPKVVLQPDDIPTTGKMDGRSRLEIIAPEAAARLASVSDAGLIDLLPPAFADTEEPVDSSSSLWFDLCKPLMSRMPDRFLAHLEAFLTYAEHAQDLALHRALTATDPGIQRTEIANWVYWQHLSVLVSDALTTDISV